MLPRRPWRIYLAGPDVFRPDAQAALARLRATCESLGLEALVPADGTMSERLTPAARARTIFLANRQLIDTADAVLANLEPFRGALEPDSGTVFEVGYAHALGKPVAAYSAAFAQLHEHRIAEHCGGVERTDGRAFERAFGWQVEEFTLPANLMLACSCALFVSADDAARYLAARSLAARAAQDDVTAARRARGAVRV